jgi:hypothetical protein
MNMTRLYLVSMFAIVFLDLFDKLYDRYGVIIDEWDPIPEKPIVFGRLRNMRDAYGIRRDIRFLFVKIPFVRTWGITNWMCSPIPQYGFRTHTLRWIEVGIEDFSGWKIWPPLEG